MILRDILPEKTPIHRELGKILSMNPDVMQDLKRQRGGVLRQVRREAGLSARKLADRINARTPGSDLTDNAIYAYESGRVLLSREVAERISAVLKVSLGELLIGDPDFVDNQPESAGRGDRGPTPDDPGRPAQRRVDPRCERLHPLVVDVLRTARTLVRMLGLRHFELASPAGFLHGFELLTHDGQRLLQHDDLPAARRADSSKAHDAIAEASRAVKDLLQHADAGYGKLRQAGQSGSCVAAARELAGTLADDVAALTLAHQSLIEAGGLKPGLPESEPFTEHDLADLTPWATLGR